MSDLRSPPLRILFALPGLHRVTRGAEVAFENIADHIARMPQRHQVTVIGGGRPRSDSLYRFIHVPCVPREHFERWPKFPALRTHYEYEDLTFFLPLLRRYDPSDYDITITCNYPWTNWALTCRKRGRYRPRHVFVTQNGDWMVQAQHREYRLFRCDGLVCTNHDYYQRNRERFPSALIPNGVDPAVFHPGPSDRRQFGLPQSAPVVLMVSALIPSKRVLEGIRAVARLDDAHLLVAGDGELRSPVEALGRQLLGRRFQRLRLPRSQMPDLYRAADVFLHMSQEEPSANAYMEALATGLPIVTHDWSVTRWTLEDQAILADTSDEGATAAALVKSLSLRGAAEVAARTALVARRFSWAQIASDYVRFFRRISAEADHSRVASQPI